MRHNLEHRLGCKVPKDCALIEWLVVRVGDVLAKFKVHENSRTTHEMNTQHAWKGKVIGFGERVHYHLKVPQGERDKCDTTNTGIGYFLGIVSRNTQYLVSTPAGVITCATVRRLPDSVVYDPACIAEVKVRYSDCIKDGAASKLVVVKFSADTGGAVADSAPIETEFVPRRAYLTPADFTRNLRAGGKPLF